MQRIEARLTEARSRTSPWPEVAAAALASPAPGEYQAPAQPVPAQPQVVHQPAAPAQVPQIQATQLQAGSATLLEVAWPAAQARGGPPAGEVIAERCRRIDDRCYRLWVEDCVTYGGVRVHAMDIESRMAVHVDLADADIQAKFNQFWEKLRRRGQVNTGDDSHGQELTGFLLRLLDVVYFELDHRGNGLELRIPHAIEPLRSLPGHELIEVPVPRKAPGSPVSKHWIRDKLLIPSCIASGPSTAPATAQGPALAVYGAPQQRQAASQPRVQSARAQPRATPPQHSARPASSQRARGTSQAAEAISARRRPEHDADGGRQLSSSRAGTRSGPSPAQRTARPSSARAPPRRRGPPLVVVDDSRAGACPQRSEGHTAQTLVRGADTTFLPPSRAGPLPGSPRTLSGSPLAGAEAPRMGPSATLGPGDPRTAAYAAFGDSGHYTEPHRSTPPRRIR
mmetsp:Transcript_17745/g.51779  ORF Transcript_17745/g.51779 Transcript_17745/m.51779 type:complete len:453 (+) Transcript_17745:298-1656(+)